MKLGSGDYYHFDYPDKGFCEPTGPKWKTVDIVCSLNPGHARRGHRLSSISVTVPWKQPPDVLHSFVEWLPQKHVVETLRREGVTGFTTTPATAVMKRALDPVTVCELKVIGWGGVLPTWTGVALEQRCPECHWKRYSAFTGDLDLIDLDDWSGSDFFMIWPLPAYVFVTRKVREIFKRRGFSGVRFSRQFPSGGEAGGFSPGGLSGWLPEDRAHAIGDPLGIHL
jgi:hypothetical protein